MKYLVVDEETGEVDQFPLDEEVPMDPVDPVNATTLRSKYTNLNIAKSLKNRIIDSVVRHTKRAKKVMLEWQETEKQKKIEKETEKKKEKENNKEAENEEKRNQENKPQNTPLKNIVKNENKQVSETKPIKNFIKESHLDTKVDDCPILIDTQEKKISQPLKEQNKPVEEKKNIVQKPKKEKKNKMNKVQQIEDSKDEFDEFDDDDDDFDYFVESVKSKLNPKATFEDEEELINEINKTTNTMLTKKKKSAQPLEKGTTKKTKPVAIEINHSANGSNNNSAQKSSRKKVTFNLSENHVTSK